MSSASVAPIQSRDRPLHAKRRLLWLAAGFGCYVLSLALARLPNFTEVVYGSSIGPRISWTLSLLTGFIPFSIAEILVLGFAGKQLVSGFRALRQVRSPVHSTKNALKNTGLTLARDFGMLILLFYVLWGFNYARATLPERLAWPAITDVTVNELANLTAQLIEGANEEYFTIHSVPDAGVPTEFARGDRTVERALDAGWREARAALTLPYLGGPYGRVKSPLLTKIYEWFGVAGFYFPFTGEANLRKGIPAIDRPKMLAHEKAHQRGVAREAEANFWGYLLATHSDMPIARYSAYVFAQRQLLGALYRTDRARADELVAARLPGVQRDMTNSRNYWRSLQGSGTAVGTAVNNAFLRTNRVTGGVRNYSHSARLIIAYARNGGRVVTDQKTR